ncbi:MAG: hypothetical protein FWC40_05270 [Proteobacteria bacterium]|nr:hypothetical protein [Pseudomonadota bacterium]
MGSIARFVARFALVLGLVLAFGIEASAKPPADMAEFQNRFVVEAKTPEGAVKLWFQGLLLWQNVVTRDLGRKILLATTHDLPANFETSAPHQTFRNRTFHEPWIAWSFCAGTSPANGYKTDLDKCELTFTGSREEYDSWAVWLKSSGADSNRKISLIKRADGIWMISNYPGMYAGVRPPQTN